MVMQMTMKGGRFVARLCVIAGLGLLSACRGGGGAGPLPGIDAQRASVRVLVQAPDHSPAAGMNVTLKKDSTPVGAAHLTDASGVAQFDDVPMGDGYRAFANGRGFQSGVTDSIKVTGSVDIQLPLTPLSAAGTGIVVGSVKENAGAPIAGAQVVCGPRTAITNASGQFTFMNMPVGQFPLTVNKTGFSTGTGTVTVPAGDVAEVATVFVKSMGGSIASYIPNGGQYLLATAGKVSEVDRTWQAPWKFTNVSLAVSADRLPSGEVAVADAAAKKVVVIDRSGRVVFTYGGLLSKLKNPSWVAADKLSGNLLITDIDGNQLIELNGKNVVYVSKGPWKQPRSATYTPNGNILVADTGNSAVAEVDHNGNVVWSYASKYLSRPVYAQRLQNGNTLITDAGFNRVIEVGPKGEAAWYYDGINGSTTGGTAVAASFATRAMVGVYDAANPGIPNFVPPADSNPNAGAGQQAGTDPADPQNPGDPSVAPPAPAPGLSLPRMATRLANGHTLIVDQGNGRVLEVDTNGQIVWQQTGMGRVATFIKLVEQGQ